MSKTLEKGQDKIQEICDALKKETLEPAKKEAEKLIGEAHAQADTIIKEAHQRSDEIFSEGMKKLEKERSVFESALEQGARQTVESLRQQVEKALFNRELGALIDKETKNPKIIAKLVEAMIKAIEKEGVKADLEALIPESVPVKEVNALIAENVLKNLKGKSVKLGTIEGGAEIKVAGKQLTLVLTDAVLKGLLSSYLRKDFRNILFSL